MAKEDLFDIELQALAKIFKALGHPARLAILRYLAETNVCISGDISCELPLSRTTVNQHLKVLKNLHLIKGSISGTKVNYCLNTIQIKKLKPLIDSYFGNLETTNKHHC